MLKTGWVYYSDEHRRNIERAIAASKTKGTLDELGLGGIRDGFSNMFFPGITTIQTRAKYFLIVPWLLDEIYRAGCTPAAFRSELKSREIKVINKLLQKDDHDGLIGKEVKDQLNTFPSSIYWSGLRTYGIIQRQKLRLGQTGRLMAQLRAHRSQTQRLSREEKLNDREQISYQHFLCHLPDFPGYTQLSLKLEPVEAQFLQGRILRSQPESLIAFLLLRNQGLGAYKTFEDMVKALNPPHLTAHLLAALKFDQVMKGAYIRYNLLIAKRKEQEVDVWDGHWRRYLNKKQERTASHGLFDRYYDWTDDATKRFCEVWTEGMRQAAPEMGPLDKMIRLRERSLKGASRARLSNQAAAAKTTLPVGVRIRENEEGIEYLDYRFRVAKRILRDINAGLRSNKP